MAGRLNQSLPVVAINSRSGGEFNRYGSTVHKQVYIYGNLDARPTILSRAYGMSWSIGGWLRQNFLYSISGDTEHRLKARVCKELTTTFASQYTEEISLAEALTLEKISEYSQRSTGKKYLINPSRGVNL